MIRSLALGLSVGALFLALALWGVPFAALRDAFRHVEWLYLLHVTAAVAVQYALRAWRQWVLLGGLAPSLGFRDHFAIVAVGFFCINAFPARLGEAVRPLLFQERAGLPLASGFALVLVERVVDLVAILTVLLVVAGGGALPARELEIAGRTVEVSELGRRAAFALLAPLLAALVGLAVFGPAALRLGRRAAAAAEARVEAPLLHRVLAGVLRFGTAFVEGLRALRSPVRLVGVAALTVLLFGSMGLMMSALVHAFGFGPRIDFGAGLAVLSITMLGIALPAPPGFAGVFEATVRGALALFGVGGASLAGRALAFALVLHWWPFLLLAAMAGWFLWRDRIGLGRLFRFARRS